MRNHKSRWKARRTWREYENDIRYFGSEWFGKCTTVEDARRCATRGMLWNIKRYLPAQRSRRLAAL